MKYLILLTIILSGCASVHLSQGGSKVRLVTTTPNNCKYLGNIESHVSGVSFDGLSKSELINDLKNKAADMGANTVEMITANSMSHDSTGEAYLCN